MLNPESKIHPACDIADSLREMFPEEIEEWESLLRRIQRSANRGCFTCKSYSPPKSLPEIIEMTEHENVFYVLPFESEAAYVACAKFQEPRASLRVYCQLWERYKE